MLSYKDAHIIENILKLFKFLEIFINPFKSHEISKKLRKALEIF